MPQNTQLAVALSLKKKVALYEQALNDMADWDLPESEMGSTDDNGAAAMWARDLLTRAGAAPKSHSTKG